MRIAQLEAELARIQTELDELKGQQGRNADVLTQDQVPQLFQGKTKEELDSMARQLTGKFDGQTDSFSPENWQQWKQEMTDEFNAKWERRLSKGDNQ